MSNKWFVVVNPRSGGGRSAKDWPEIARLLTEAGIEYQAQFTEFQGHAITVAGEAIRRGYKHILAVGGDGTANEVVNGLFYQNAIASHNITFGLIPVGTGNDWIRTIGIPAGYREAILALASGKTILQDVGIARFFRENEIHKRYFINVSGMGYDAMVASQTNRLKQKGRGNPIWYLWSLFLCLLKYKHTLVKVAVDQKELEGHVFSLSVGIGKFNGGGMMQLPKALPDDGFYDVTVIHKIGKLDIIRNIRNLYDGTFISHPQVTVLRGKKISVSSKPQIFLEVDGELVGHSSVEYDILPGSLRVVVA